MNRKKPFIVEFTGTPEAGKTTVIHKLCEQLKKIGYSVKIYPENIELLPKTFPKVSTHAAVWVNCDTLKNVLEATFLSDYDIVIFDRGSYDKIFWSYLYFFIDLDIAMKYVPFINLYKNYLPDLLITFIVSEEQSIIRRGGEGSVVTKSFICRYNQLLNAFIESITTNKLIVNTENMDIKSVVEHVLKSILKEMK